MALFHEIVMEDEMGAGKAAIAVEEVRGGSGPSHGITLPIAKDEPPT